MTRIAAPPPDLKVSEWADAERRLSPESSAEPGQWNTDRFPPQREIMDCFNDPAIEMVVGKMSSQVGKTEIILNVAGYHIDQDPAPMMIMQFSDQLAETFSKDRLAPMIRDTPVLKGKVRDVKSRDSNNTILHKKFHGGQLTMVGANSAANLAMRPIRILLMDEVSRYPASAGKEGDPVNLARKRTSTFWNKKIGAFSSPGIKGACRIDSLWEISDQRRYEVPCPHCKKPIEFKFSRFKWDPGNAESVVYLCQECDAVITHEQKFEMIASGRWKASRPFNGIAGFHIWEAYSPWKKWSEIVADFLDAKTNPEKLKAFVNTSLGECWEQKGDAPEWENLYERREQWKIGTVQEGAYFLTAGVDVQADRLEVEVVGWGRHLESWSVDYHILQGDTTTDVPWQKLEALLVQTWPTTSGQRMPIRMMAVDSGYNTQRVYSWVRKFPRDRVIAVKGNDSMPVMIGTPKHVDVNFQGKKISRGLLLWSIGVNILKSETYGFLKLRRSPDAAGFPAGYCHFPEYDQEAFKQLTAEHVVIRKNGKGFSVPTWEKVRDRNERLDARVYARAAASVLGVDRLQDEDWDALKALVVAPVQTKTSGNSITDDKRNVRNRKPSTYL